MSTSTGAEGSSIEEQEIEHELRQMEHEANKGQLTLPGSQLGRRKVAERRIKERKSAA